jgi:2-succinyl-5-enolpyruvyl-6-hydroxy-3-cyclohexene-1-carboxylate synthase
LNNFYEPSLKPKILEIESSSPKNADILKQVKEKVKKAIEEI